ncbi:MAG: tail fiber protein [Victivallaceae bacterium]|nr:tail fiber protein [Victivallaceae bacterium]
MAEPFISEVRLFPYSANVIPNNWALCNGASIPRGQLDALFSLIGTIYGGDGVVNFQLPDLQGRVPMQCGNASGLSPHSLGEKNGNEKISLGVDQIPHHRHETKVVHDTADQSDPAGTYLAFDDSPDVKVYENCSKGNYVAMNKKALKTTGNGNGHENRQPFIALHFCIALDGTYPPRGD